MGCARDFGLIRVQIADKVTWNQPLVLAGLDPSSWYGATGVRLLLGAGTLLGGYAYDVEDLAGLLRRYRLDPRDLTDLFGGALVVDVGEIGGDEAAVVRFTLGG